MVRPREIAQFGGVGRTYFNRFWGRDLAMLNDAQIAQDQARAIFIHIPKAGGVSVTRCVYGSEHLFGHAPACAWASRDAERFRRMFKFSIMRDPIDRFVSAFHYLKGNPLTDRDRIWARRMLADYSTPDELAVSMGNSRFIRARIMSWVHFTPQHWYVTDRANRIMVDYIGRTEDFDGAMRDISQRLGRPLPPVHANAGSGPETMGITPQGRASLERLYANDIHLYRTLFDS